MKIRVATSMPFDENSYIVWLDGRNDCVVIDPGLEPDLIFDVLREHDLSPAAILNTHGHADHIAGNEAMKEAFPSAPLMIGKGEADFLTDAVLNLSQPFGMALVSPPADRLLVEGETLELAGMSFEILEIPGHSPGHILFYDKSRGVVFGGDVLFAGSVGRGDFPGGSSNQLAEGIRKKLYKLPDETGIYPGHGPATTIGDEKRTNPFVRAE